MFYRLLNTMLVTLVASSASPALAATTTDQPVYQKGLATNEQRLAQPQTWTRLPDFKSSSLEVIADGVRREPQATTLEAQKTLDLKSLQWLNVRDLDVGKAEAITPGDVVIPIAYGIRYQRNWVIQGTLEVVGKLHVKIDEGGKVAKVELISFDDSQGLERFARSVYILSNYDGAFVADVSRPLLEKYFSDPKNLGPALAAAGQTLVAPNPAP